MKAPGRLFSQEINVWRLVTLRPIVVLFFKRIFFFNFRAGLFSFPTIIATDCLCDNIAYMIGKISLSASIATKGRSIQSKFPVQADRIELFLKCQQRHLDCSPKLWARMLLLYKSQDDAKLITKDVGKAAESFSLCFYHIDMYSHQETTVAHGCFGTRN